MPRFRNLLFSLLVYIAFFASGAACLVAEVTWNRMLIVVVGNSLGAAAMILVVFMGGLGLGSWLGGRIFAGRRPSLLPYALLECGVGVYVLASPYLFDALASVFASLAEGTPGIGLDLVRITVSMAALLLPACLMGATFPAMIAGADPRSPLRRTARTGYLYSVNTLGAAVGCFAAGYHLLFEFGVRFTLACGFALYGTAALCALIVHFVSARTEGEEAGHAAAAGPGVAGPSPADPDAFLLFATFGIGFVALSYEVLLTRLAILYLGNSVSVFPLVLTAFLLGTGISAIAGTRAYDLVRNGAGQGRPLFGSVAVLAGVLVFVTPYLLLSDRVLGMDRFARFADVTRTNPLPILGLVVLPTMCIGALLPLAIRMSGRGARHDATRDAARLYAANTFGGLLGAGVANHLLVPRIGIENTMLGLTALCVGIGAYAFALPWPPARRRIAAAGAAASVAAVLAVATPSMMGSYADKVARSTRAQSAEVRLLREGRAATVTVIDQQDPSLGTYRDMYLNGVEEASTRYWHAQLFKLLGVLPVAMHASDGPKDALVIAFGAGITAGSALASDEVASLDVVDLNPDIKGINDLFTDVNGNVFHEPRFHFRNDDGRSHLVTCGRRYDVIISDSTHPRAYDSWILYTEEFYRAVQRRLKDHGVFAQWVPVLGSMQGDLMRIHLNTFRTVFPNASFWYVYGSDQAFLLATPEPLVLDVPRLDRKLAALPPWFRAREYDLHSAAKVAGFFWMDPDGIARMVGSERRINRDDRHYFDKQSTVWPSPPERRLPAFQASVLPFLRGATATQEADAAREQLVAQGLARWGFFRSEDDLLQAYCLDADNGNVRYFMDRRFAEQPPGREALCREREIARYREAVARRPDDVFALNALAQLLAEAGVLDEAGRFAARAVEAAPTNANALDTCGWILLRQDRVEEAIETLTRASRLMPDHPVLHYHLGRAYLRAGREVPARRALERATMLSTTFPERAEALRLLGRSEGAAPAAPAVEP